MYAARALVRSRGFTALAIVTLVLAAATRVIAIGTAIGLAAAAVLGRSIRAFLFGVQPLDPVTFAAVALVVGVTAAAASAVPALRATRVDPLTALWYE